MAVRSRLEHDDLTTQKIQSTQIVNRLNKHVLSEDGDIMTASQVKAAGVLLNKVIPDLRSSDIVIGATEITHEQWLESIRGGDSEQSTDADSTPVTE